MKTIIKNPKPLTRLTFELFGDVIEVSDEVNHFTINQGYAERYHDLAKVDVSAEDGQALISIFRTIPLPLPITLKTMERHPLSSQAFIPMNARPYLVAVAPAGDFDPMAIEVFLALGNQGINYHRGTWHHACLALGQCSDFLIIDRGGRGNNCDQVSLPEKQQIRVEL